MTERQVGFASYADMKARTMAVERGERRVGRGEPKVWFTSTESFAKILHAADDGGIWAGAAAARRAWPGGAKRRA